MLKIDQLKIGVITERDKILPAYQIGQRAETVNRCTQNIQKYIIYKNKTFDEFA